MKRKKKNYKIIIHLVNDLFIVNNVTKVQKRRVKINEKNKNGGQEIDEWLVTIET